MGLFQEKINLELPNSDITYFPDFLSPIKAQAYFKALKNNVAWQQDDIKVFGKTYAQPRLTALYANNKKAYTYSNITMHPHMFSGELLEIKQKLERDVGIVFTTCLVNRYRDGKDSNGWHADDEKELGQNPIIASVSLGEQRYFHLRHKEDKALKHKILLENGSLLLMKGETQHFWQHQIPKTAKKLGNASI